MIKNSAVESEAQEFVFDIEITPMLQYKKEKSTMEENLARLMDDEPLISHPLVEKYNEFVLDLELKNMLKLNNEE